MEKGQTKKDSKVVKKLFRFSRADWAQIKRNAKACAGGNVTAWVTHAGKNAPKERLVPKNSRSVG